MIYARSISTKVGDQSVSVSTYGDQDCVTIIVNRCVGTFPPEGDIANTIAALKEAVAAL